MFPYEFIYDCLWSHMMSDEVIWFTMNSDDPMKSYVVRWMHLISCEFRWLPWKPYGFLCIPLMSYRAIWLPMLSHNVLWSFLISDGFRWSSEFTSCSMESYDSSRILSISYIDSNAFLRTQWCPMNSDAFRWIDLLSDENVLFRKAHNRQEELETDWPVCFQLCPVAHTVL